MRVRTRALALLAVCSLAATASCGSVPEEGVDGRQPVAPSSAPAATRQYECRDLQPDSPEPDGLEGSSDTEFLRSRFSEFAWTPECVILLLTLHGFALGHLDEEASDGDAEGCAQTREFFELLRDKISGWPPDADAWLGELLRLGAAYADECGEIGDEEITRRDVAFAAIRCIRLRLAADYPDLERLGIESIDDQDLGPTLRSIRSLDDCDILP